MNMRSLLLLGGFEQPLKDLLLTEFKSNDFSVKELQKLAPKSDSPKVNTAPQDGPPTTEEETKSLESADVVLYMLRRSEENNVARLLRVLRNRQDGKEATFIAVSNLLTWGRLRIDSDEPCTSADETRRRPHPQYGGMLEAERKITRAQKAGVLRTYIIWPGLQYGEGEGILQEMFQDSWSGTGPSIHGPGENVLPSIYVADLAAYIRHVASVLPPEQHLIAVDEGRCTQKALVESIASHFGADVSSAPSEGTWRPKRSVDPSLLLDLPLLATAVEGMTWQYKEGPVHHVGALARAFMAARGLSPLRVFIHGPPAAGKSALARALFEEYGVDLISVAPVIKWAVEECEDIPLRQAIATALSPPPAAPLEGVKKKGQSAPPPVEISKSKPRLSDALLARAVRAYLASERRGSGVRRNGFILDGFPKTLSQAQLLFEDETPVKTESSPTPEPALFDTEPSKANSRSDRRVSRSSPLQVRPQESVASSIAETEERKELLKVNLDWAIFLKAPDDMLAARVALISETERNGTHDSGAEFARRITSYQESSLPEFDKILESVRKAGASVLEIDQAECATETEPESRPQSAESSASAFEKEEIRAEEEQQSEAEQVDEESDTPRVQSKRASDASPRLEEKFEAPIEKRKLSIIEASLIASKEPTGMSLELVLARVKVHLGPPERYVGSKRQKEDKSEPDEQTEAAQQNEEVEDECHEAAFELDKQDTPETERIVTVPEECNPQLSEKMRATLEERSAGLQAWLASAVMPTALQAMLHAARARGQAEDPIQEMGQHLLHLARLQEARERAQMA